MTLSDIRSQLVVPLHAEGLSNLQIARYLNKRGICCFAYHVWNEHTIARMLDKRRWPPMERYSNWLVVREKIVRLILDLREQGYAYSAIAETLNENGFLSLRGNPWNKDTAAMLIRSYQKGHKPKVSEGRLTLYRDYVRPLIDLGLSNAEVADRLNAEGVTNMKGRSWTACVVSTYRTEKWHKNARQ